MELNGVLVVLALLSNKGLGPRTDPNSNGIKIIMVRMGSGANNM